MKVIDYIRKKGWKFKETSRTNSGTQYIMQCPFCQAKEKTFAINATTGAYNCLRLNNCGVKGGFEALQKELGDSPERLDKSVETYIKVKDLKKNYTTPVFIRKELSEKNFNYLKDKRCLSEKTIREFDIFEGSRGEIIFPFKKKEKIVNLKHFIPAEWMPNNKKYMRQETNAEPTLYNIDSVKNFDYLICCEGEIDCMSLVQYGCENVTSMPSGIDDLRFIENEWEFLDKFKEIFIIVDTDEAGQRGAKNLISRLGIWRCRNVILPHKDANECLVNKVSNETIGDCFENAQTFEPVELKSASDFCEEVIDLFRNPEKFIGEETGLPDLTEKLGGFRKREVTVWTGDSGSGKSTLLTQLCLFFAYRKKRVCIASLELPPARYLRWGVCQATGDPSPPDKKIIDMFKWVDNYFYVLDIEGDVPPEKLFEIFEYAARRYDIDYFIIDSFMKIQLNNPYSNEEQTKFMQSLVNFTRKFPTHTHLVAHPRKGENDDSVPDKASVSGTKNITNLADNVLSLWRVPESRIIESTVSNADAVLFVKKNRELGTEGKVKLNFDPLTKRFLCFNQTNIFY